jgi:poly-gamma-glutamate synthesis protein (capsule biosynthesis protein)
MTNQKNKTSIIFTGDIGFDRYMDQRWKDENLLSQPLLDFFRSADHVVANVEGPLIDAEDNGSWQGSGGIDPLLSRRGPVR